MAVSIVLTLSPPTGGCAPDGARDAARPPVGGW